MSHNYGETGLNDIYLLWDMNFISE